MKSNADLHIAVVLLKYGRKAVLISSAWSLEFVCYSSRGWSSGYAFGTEATNAEGLIPLCSVICRHRHAISVGFVCVPISALKILRARLLFCPQGS